MNKLFNKTFFIIAAITANMTLCQIDAHKFANNRYKEWYDYLTIAKKGDELIVDGERYIIESDCLEYTKEQKPSALSHCRKIVAWQRGRFFDSKYEIEVALFKNEQNEIKGGSVQTVQSLVPFLKMLLKRLF